MKNSICVTYEIKRLSQDSILSIDAVAFDVNNKKTLSTFFEQADIREIKDIDGEYLYQYMIHNISLNSLLLSDGEYTYTTKPIKIIPDFVEWCDMLEPFDAQMYIISFDNDEEIKKLSINYGYNFIDARKSIKSLLKYFTDDDTAYYNFVTDSQSSLPIEKRISQKFVNMEVTKNAYNLYREFLERIYCTNLDCYDNCKKFSVDCKNIKEVNKNGMQL